MNDLIYWVWLSLCFSPANEKPNEIISIYETPKSFYEAFSKNSYCLNFLSKSDITKLKKITLAYAQEVLNKAFSLKMQVHCQKDKLFPKRLLNIYGAPLVIYVYGDISGIDDEVSIAIVGTRNISNYGDVLTKNMAFEIAKAGGIVVSGCALGADTSALVGALKAGGKTIGVLASGLDVDYPKENRHLKAHIIKRGALISEMPPSTPAHAFLFPLRNRLISALSLGVLITEAPRLSGSLITLNHAISQGKDVFCVPPYNVFDVSCSGVIQPLRDGAIPVFCANDVLLEYYSSYPQKLNKAKVIESYIKIQKANTPSTNKKTEKEKIKQKPKPIIENKLPSPPDDYSGEKLQIFNALSFDPLSVEIIAAKTNIPLNKIYPVLTELEILGIVCSHPGARYSFFKN